jgi:cell division protein FtsL
MISGIRKFKETVEIRSSLVNQVRSHRHFSLAILIAVVLMACCIHVWQRVKVKELVQDVASLTAEREGLIDRSRKTYSDIAELSLAVRIQNYATDSLGLSLVESNRMYTLLREDRPAVTPDNEMATLVSALQRVTAFLPVVVESQASAAEVDMVKFDSLPLGGDGK